MKTDDIDRDTPTLHDLLEMARQLREVLAAQVGVLQEDWVAEARAEREAVLLASLEVPHS